MTRTEKSPIHVAGIQDAEEAEMLIGCGVRRLGLPLVLGYHREDLSPAEAAAIVSAFADQATFFLITYLDTAAAIDDLCRVLGVAMVQLHGPVELEEIMRLRERAPDLRVIKSLIVRSGETDSLREDVDRFAPAVDSFITDTFDPATGAIGATGKTHDWAVSRALVEASPKPVILAGGLNADNVGEAIRTVQPAGVDVHTGIEGPDGRKDRALTARFVAEAKAALASLEQACK